MDAQHMRPMAGEPGPWHQSWRSRGWKAYVVALVLTSFYCLLYWFPHHLDPVIRWFDPLSESIRRRPADNWFMYGACYTLAVGVMGVRFLRKYRHNAYQVWRTVSLIFFQLFFAFLLPGILQGFGQPEFYFTYFWPLKPEYLFPDSFSRLVDSGHLGIWMAGWSLIASVVLTPVLTWYFGKRWYCSWVCGCGALAETAGDPFRHLSDRSRNAWHIERVVVYSVLVFIILLTALLWIQSAGWGSGWFGDSGHALSRIYGFLIGGLFSGVIGVGFYPLLGGRTWCRFGCPMAAILGLQQRWLSRFRITVNKGQCISCGLCSSQCEMGIDVRAYAQRGEAIRRASCVGCGICAEVCPRSVLRLENQK